MLRRQILEIQNEGTIGGKKRLEGGYHLVFCRHPGLDI